MQHFLLILCPPPPPLSQEMKGAENKTEDYLRVFAPSGICKKKQDAINLTDH